VTGADFDALARRAEADGQVQGWASLTGIWSTGQLRIEQQTAPEAAPRVTGNRWVTPPCPTPAGGWPQVTRRGDIELDYDLGDLESSGAAVAVTLFRPAENHAVLVIAAADPTAVEAWLRPQLGLSLCVVPSRWSKNQLEGVRSHLSEHFERWHLLQLGTPHDQDGQPHVAADLARVRPDIAACTATLPAGIVELKPWMTPVTSRNAAAGHDPGPQELNEEHT